MENLLSSDGQLAQLAQMAYGMIMAYAPKVILAIITLLVGLWLINRFVGVLRSRLGSKDPTLGQFLCGLVSITLKVMLLISVASMVGIATTSFVAVVGAAGLAIGLALQGSLANFAGGVLILLFKPFKVGDAISAQGYLGSVVEIQILYTVLNTFDNQRIIIPNGSLANASVTNLSAYPTRRCDMTIGIGYGDDIDHAKATIKRLIEEDPRSLKDPASMVVVGELGESSVDFIVRVWVNASDLFAYKCDMLEKVKKAFDAEGISIPFPQRDVHIHETKQA